MHYLIIKMKIKKNYFINYFTIEEKSGRFHNTDNENYSKNIIDNKLFNIQKDSRKHSSFWNNEKRKRSLTIL